MKLSFSRPRRTNGWIPLAFILGPPLVFVVALNIPGAPGLATLAFVGRNWGNVASVWGLAVSIYVLVVARGARKAAEEARSTERLRTAVEGLQEAAEKTRQIGLLARANKWDLVQLRSEEVLTICRSTVARWGDQDVLKESKNKLLTVSTIMRSIAEESGKPDVDAGQVVKAQLDASEMLSSVVGKAHKGHESRS